MTDPTTPAMQDYLKAIYELEEGGREPTAKALADKLEVTPASASNMVKRLAELELVDHEPYKGASLTPAGELTALEVIRHHRLLELFLVETLGLSWDEVHEEAEILEHHISEELEARIAEQLGHPDRDPHGDPIPSLEGELPVEEGQPLAHVPEGEEVRLLRVNDQDPDVLRFLGSKGLFPGAEVAVARRNAGAGVVVVEVDGQPVHLGLPVAEEIEVEPLRPRDARDREGVAA